jgi:putative membrane protein
MMVLQAIPALRFALVPGPIKTRRVHERALQAFRVGAEQRTTGRTGVLIYLSMREHRAEVLADAAIATKVDVEVWTEALEALLSHVRTGDIASGMCAAIERVGTVLAAHAPRVDDDRNEVPDRLIEI